MVKVGILLGSFLCTFGMILQIISFMSSLRFSTPIYGLTYYDLMYWSSPSTSGNMYALPFWATVLVYSGMAFVLFMAISTKKVLVIIGGIIYGLGELGIMFMWIFRLEYIWDDINTTIIGSSWFLGVTPVTWIYLMFNIITFVGSLLFMIGLITFRKSYPAGIVFGILLVVASYGANILFMFNINYGVFLSDSEYTAVYLSIYLILILVQTLVFTLNAWIMSFSKSTSNPKKEEDTMSIEKGNAFESYVETTKKPKEKKPAPSANVEFKF